MLFYLKEKGQGLIEWAILIFIVFVVISAVIYKTKKYNTGINVILDMFHL